MSNETVRKVLRDNNIDGRVAHKKPLISKTKKGKRLDFAKTFESKPDEFWNRVIFSDESKFNIFGSDGRRMVWRNPWEKIKKAILKSTVKYGGGSVLVWGCMSANGAGNLIFIDGIMDKNDY